MHKVYRLEKFINAKIPLSVFAMVLLFALFSPIIYAESAKEGIVNTECLNVRQSPCTSAAIAAQLLKDTKIEIDEFQEGWYKITYGNIKGWVHADYVTTEQTMTVTENAGSNGSSINGASNGEPQKTGVITANVLNVRESAGTSSKVAAQLEKGMDVNVIETNNSNNSETWHKVSYGKITGWISGEYISFKYEPIDAGVVDVDVANVRTAPDISSKIATQMTKGQKLDIYAWSGEWYKIKLQDENFAWIFNELVSTRNSFASRESTGARGQSSVVDRSLDKRQQIVSLAKKYLGVKYVWGGTSPKGFDCSGLVQYVYKQIGITLNRVAADQATQGTKVSRAELKPGDLVFFNTSSGSSIDHVGIYIGGGNFLHAANGRGKVLIDPLDHSYYKNRMITARRIIK
ncbi:MAG TPA: SH3 domain-containing protein [Clostridiales bacterium]|nr:SH3 domain-containing protein [Clostridiales bacterium]